MLWNAGVMITVVRLRHLGEPSPRSVLGALTPAECVIRVPLSVGVRITAASRRRPRTRLSQSVPRDSIPAGCATRALWSVGVMMTMVGQRRPRAPLPRSVLGSFTPAECVIRVPLSVGEEIWKFDPTPSAGIFTSVSAGPFHSCGVRDTGVVVCWGNDGSGQSSPPAGIFTSVSAGYYHSCGVRDTGAVACWDDNEDGQSTTPGGDGPDTVVDSGNDSFFSRSAISGASGQASGSNVGATKESGEPNHAGNAGGASVWWSWTAPATGPVTFDTRGSDFDTLLAVYTGSSVGALTPVAYNDDAPGGGTYQSEVSFTAQQGVAYQIAVDGYGGVTGAIVLNWSQAGGPGGTCDPFVLCGLALTCVDGLEYPTTCGPRNCDLPRGPCVTEDPGPDPGAGGSTFASRASISGASGRGDGEQRWGGQGVWRTQPCRQQRRGFSVVDLDRSRDRRGDIQYPKQ